MGKNISSTIRWTAVIVVIITNAVFISLSNGASGVVMHDVSSYLAPLKGLLDGTGSPYTDYLDIKPPMLLGFLLPWVWACGWSMTSMVILDITLISVMFTLTYFLLRKFTPGYFAEFLLLSALIATWALNLFSLLVLSETIGSIWILVAVLFLFRRNTKWSDLMLAGFFFAMAMQTKEVYAFAGLAGVTVILLAGKQIWRRGISLASGFILGQVATLILLFTWGSLSAYFEILSLKSALFPRPSFISLMKSTFVTFRDQWSMLFGLSYVVPLVLIGTFFILYIRQRKQVNLSGKSGQVVFTITSFTLLASLDVGFAWQAKPLANHYFVTLLTPVLLVVGAGIGLLFIFIRTVKSPWRKVFATSAATLLILPPLTSLPAAAITFTNAQINANWTLKPQSGWDGIFNAVAQNSTESDCIQVAYGWAAGNVLLYADRKPCSSVYLSNFGTIPEIGAKLRSDLLQHPPAVIIYNPSGADLDVTAYEETAFPYSSILEKCYLPTENAEVWKVKSTNKSLTRDCFREVLN